MRAERDRLLEQIFEDSSDPTFIIDPVEDRILAVNRAGCAMLGYTREEMLATPVSQVHPAELPQFRAFLRSVRRDGRGSRINLTCRTKGGTFLPTEMSLHAFAREGRFYILGLVQDRSQHRQPPPERVSPAR
jgi:chemotaxis family two-component system sensor kinase Cph1